MAEKKPIRTASPTLRRLFEIADEQGMSLYTLAERTKRARNNLSDCRLGRTTPNIILAEEIAAALGVEITIKEKKS